MMSFLNTIKITGMKKKIKFELIVVLTAIGMALLTILASNI
jgi:hypothetical protein